MKNTLTIAQKEFKSYLASPMAYVVTGIFLVLTGVFFGVSSSTYYATSISGFLESGSIILLLLAAVLTMRLIAEERKIGTIELLLTAPVRDSEIILGKFLGSLGILVVMLALTLYYPFLLFIFGDPDIGPILTGYLGIFLLGSTCLSIGLFASSLTSNQIVSAVVAGGILFALWFIGVAAGYLPEALGEIINYFSLSYYFSDFVMGIIDTRSIIYYLSITVLFIFLAIRSLENSRWS
jgi:ABC-2 type transport system permease protein